MQPRGPDSPHLAANRFEKLKVIFFGGAVLNR
jgi:hypothetical protein